MVSHIILTNIGSRVANGNFAVLSIANVLLYIPRDRLNIWCSFGGGDTVDDFVTGEEHKQVCVIMEHVNSGENVLQINVVVRLCGLVLSNRVLGRVDVQGKVDSSGFEGLHAGVVVLAVVDCVNAKGVYAQFGKPEIRKELAGNVGIGLLSNALRNISRATVGIGQWVNRIG